MKKRVFCCLASLLCWSAVAVRAAKVDTVEVHSRKMGRAVRTIVISPEKTEGKGAAVVYLLHGYGGNETTWPSLKPELKDYADRENLIFVCPNGENSWYWDSPLNEDSQFETFVSRELVSYVDGHYRTLPSREKRAITGLSMGGHGALWIIFDCGYDDFFFEVNQAFHQKLLERGVMHDFIVRPGAHTGEYWSNSIDYQILFFLKFFRASH